MKFSDRKRLAEAFELWAEKNGVARSALGIITWLDIIGALDERRSEIYLNEEEKRHDTQKN